ncbi:hypothetical protein [Oryzihumus leptocrescens]|uniref:Uncharacterized protein n=1 Tax=Oryzihumus leptocrescens TaxID=297536 RepID=A0A542ZEH4_9MICO|nr:hypothetical protein [Oryzihumus leptocrescens]TQL58746.1 hypothetical protein FB474_0082 [Oryzihumus leptocrescens]
MTDAVVGIVPDGRTIAVAVVRTDGGVVESLTVHTHEHGKRVGEDALADLPDVVAVSRAAVGAALAILAAHDLIAALWAVHSPVPVPPRTAKAASADRAGHVVAARQATMASWGAVVALVTSVGAPVVTVAPAEVTSAAEQREVPTALTGSRPHWPLRVSRARDAARPGKGVGRAAEQEAYWVAVAGLAGLATGEAERVRGLPMVRPVVPAAASRRSGDDHVTTPGLPSPAPQVDPAARHTYALALRSHVRSLTPETPEDLLTAARSALTAVAPPQGAPALTAVEVAADAVLNAGVAPGLHRLPADLIALLTQADRG